jgi:hypothetical protein
MSEPCKDCPQPVDKDEQGEPTIPKILGQADKSTVGWVLYTGGPPERHLAMMQHTLPDGYQYGRFLPDGSIQYEKGPDGWEPPSPIEGYERDAEDQWFFRPLWESCQLRMYGTVVKEACECIQVLTVCSHPETKLNEHGEVTFAMCQSCPRRVPILVPITPKRTPLPESFRLPESDQARSGPGPQ